MEPKKIISIRWELYKLYNEGYTHQQMMDFLQVLLEGDVITTDELIDALVDSRFNELVLNKRLDAVVEALKS